MEPHSKHYFVTQSGLVGEGLPFHRSLYVAEQKSYGLQPGKDTIEVRLRAREAAGARLAVAVQVVDAAGAGARPCPPVSTRSAMPFCAVP